MLKTNKKKILNVSVDANERKSRFLVDLKPAPVVAPDLHDPVDFTVAALDKVKPFIPEKVGTVFSEFYSRNGARLKSLAVFRLFALVFRTGVFLWRIFYRFCHLIGWTAVFLVRFVYLLSARLLGPLAGTWKKMIALAGSSHPTIKKIHEAVSGLSASVAVFFRSRRADRQAEEFYHAALNYQPVAVEDPIYRLNDKDFDFAGSGHSRFAMESLRQTALFGIALLVLILPLKALTFYSSFDLEGIKGKILGASEEGARDFVSASESVSAMDFSKAGEDFSQAGDDFLRAKQELDEINGVLLALASFAPDKKMRMASEADNILNAGKIASDMGNNLTLAVKGINDKSGERNLKKILDDVIEFGGKAAADAEELDAVIRRIDKNNIPEGYADKFSLMAGKSSLLKDSLGEFVRLAGSLKEFFGMTMDKRYLLVFQNNSELRASGGFIGSFAVIDFRDGKIKNLITPGGGSYDTEAGLKVKVNAPEPMRLVNPLWHFWDANWWPDWPTTARKLEWFYEKSDGSTVDGVISLTPTVMEKMLSVLGSFDMTDKYGTVITADNFWLTTQRFAEQKPDKTKEPKKIVGDLMSKMIEELPKRLDLKSVVGLMRVMEDSFDGKQILFYFNDQDLEDKIAGYGWDGAMKKTSRDYLSVINTNIAGGKSDRKMKEKIIHHADIASDGTITDTVVIERTHTGQKREEFSGVRNVDWMRVYVPLGSKFISASGFRQPDSKYFSNPEAGWEDDPDVYRAEMMTRTDKDTNTKIYEEGGYTVFANWSMTDPGETSVIRLTYELPWKLVGPEKDETILGKINTALGLEKADIRIYSLLVQKQPGAAASDIQSSVKLDMALSELWKYPKDMVSTDDGWSISDSLDKDKYWVVMLGKNNIK